LSKSWEYRSGFVRKTLVFNDGIRKGYTIVCRVLILSFSYIKTKATSGGCPFLRKIISPQVGLEPITLRLTAESEFLWSVHLLYAKLPAKPLSAADSRLSRTNATVHTAQGRLQQLYNKLRVPRLRQHSAALVIHAAPFVSGLT